jgi:hypothetical protein
VSKLVMLQEDFSGGMARDFPLAMMPKGKSRKLLDYFPSPASDYSATAPLTRRAGWKYPFNTMTGVDGGVGAVFWGPFTGASRLLAVANHAGVYRLWKFTPGVAAGTNIGVITAVFSPPTFYRENSIICGYTGSPYKYDNTTLAALGGTPPAARHTTVFKDHVLLANTTANTNRVWFSKGGDAETWVTTDPGGQWIDCSSPVRGLATVRNMVLCFQGSSTERLRGDVIPGVVGSDMVREPLLSIGCSDARSIATTNDYCIFANQRGIYMCDGIGAVDLTLQAGVSDYWRTVNNDWSIAGGVSAISGAIWNDWYFFSIVPNSFPALISGAIHIPTRRFVEISNFCSPMMVATPSGGDPTGSHLYGALYAAGNVGTSTTPFTPVDLGAMMPGTPELLLNGLYLEDADGTDIGLADYQWGARLETPYYQLKSKSLKRWKSVYLTTYAEVATTVTVYRLADPQGFTYTSMGTYTASGYNRKRFPIGKAIDGLGLRIVPSASAGRFEVHSIEAEVWETESSRR